MTEQQCPSCHAAIPVDHHYVTWCEHCGWNLQPQQPARPRNVFEVLYASLGQRRGRNLYRDMAHASTLKPALSLARLLAFGFATVVHGVTLLLVVLGVALLSKGWPNPFAIIGGLFCLAAAVTVRPRIAKTPTTIVPRDRCPTLYKLADSVAQALGAPGVDGIVIDARFNASFSQVGWRRRKIVTLGLPLFAVLDSRERVALLAHELAHGVNGDLNRSFFVGTAINSLASWHYLLRPERIWDRRMNSFAFGAAIGNLMSLGLSRVAWLCAYALSHLLWSDMQRAEYQADHLAAQVSGTAAALSTLDKLHLSPMFSQAVRTASLGGQSLSMFDELERLVVNLPERELERIRRVERLEASRLDATHPPTAYRIAFLQARDVSSAQVTVSRLDDEALKHELAPFRATVQEKLLDLHRRSLYY